MEINRLELINFRNFGSEAAEFGPGLNLLIGSNGQGKTNLLEAVYAIGSGSSHRAGLNAAMIRQGENAAFLHGSGLVRARTISWDAEFPRGAPARLMVDKNPARRSPSSQTLAAVHFSPEDLDLVKGGPEQRRHFLDEVSSRCRPAAKAAQLEYEKTLRQRNRLLKEIRANPRSAGQLDVWTLQLAAAGARVAADRLRLVDEAAGLIEEHYRRLSGLRPAVVTEYSASWRQGEVTTEGLQSSLHDALERAKGADIDRALTTMGPHRDDLYLAVGDLDARQFASQGEQRTLSIALRLTEKDLVTAARNEKPVLLLDDVFSELDQSRKGHVAELVKDAGQTIATSTSREGLDLSDASVLEICDGAIISRA
ncbi:MAG: DNA replication/repair protein RecF [Actinomycetota bacterium]